MVCGSFFLSELQQDSPRNQKTRRRKRLLRSSLRAKSSTMSVGTSTPGFGVFLLVVLCTASGFQVYSVARGLHREVYIQPRPPCSESESVRGWRTEVNETAPRRGGEGRSKYVRGRRVCVRVW